ncbi:uncharacterized protein B0H18DRAFT_879372, partial [Fomitopsis serialis]|uniref:uncharacterized protein n=1 Tax=Fomitopsis serialis TaxID=139415 RepID=UPI0020083D14
ALCCYDWMLTFGHEVDLIWKSKQSPVTILFYGIRYPALLNTVIEMLSRISWRSWHQPTAFGSLRIYATFDRNPWIVITVLLIGVVNPIITVVSTLRASL